MREVQKPTDVSHPIPTVSPALALVLQITASTWWEAALRPGQLQRKT